MSLTIPDTAFNPTATIVGRKSYIIFTPDGEGSPAPLTIVCEKIDIEAEADYLERKVPVGKYIITDRKVSKELKFAVKAELSDVKPVLKYFGSLPFSRPGSGEVFVCDPSDATGAVAIHLEPFKCEISNDGTLTFDGENFTKLGLLLAARQDVKVVIDDDGATPGGD